MFKKILLILTVLMALCISVCAESVSYDISSKTVENTGSFAIIKKDEKLYFSGENNYINIDLEKGDMITLLKWNSYADLRPLTEPLVYTVCSIDYMNEGNLLKNGITFLEAEQKFPSVPEKNGYEIKWSYKQQGENHIVANAEYENYSGAELYVPYPRKIFCPQHGQSSGAGVYQQLHWLCPVCLDGKRFFPVQLHRRPAGCVHH